MKKRIVITGGPSGGKTTLVEALRKDLEAIAIVPEAASLLYRGGFPRHSGIQGQKRTQRAIYFVQRELESWTEVESGRDVIICDRGTLDGMAYWPDPRESFFSSVGSSEQQELQRYDWVLHLDTADAKHFDTSNTIRTESYLEALALNEKIASAWKNHPQRLVISHAAHFFEKMEKARSVIEAILQNQTWLQIQKSLDASN